MADLRKVVSGGQTGVDRAALGAAQRAGLDIGGWCPPGRSCESGSIPDGLPLRETPAERSTDAPDVPRSMRTEWNVRDSDATLVLRVPDLDRDDPGTEWTVRCAERYGRPLLECDPNDEHAAATIAAWLGAWSVRTLNVAGPSERTNPGIRDQAFSLLNDVFARILRAQR